MSISKLNFNSVSLIDLTDTSVDSSTLHQAYTAHSSIGNSVLGAAASSFPVENALVDGSYSGSYENNRITELGVNCSFRYLPSLTSVNLPEVTTLNGYDFDGCTSLESVELPKLTTITTTGYNFRNTAITSIAWPSTIIPTYCFYGCSSLEQIPNAENLTSVEVASFEKCTSLSSVSLPNVTTVGNTAFRYDTTLRSVSLPQVTGSYMCGSFSGCTALESVYLPKWTGGYSDNTFTDCTSLSVLVLPSINRIHNKLVWRCTNLEKLDLSNSNGTIATITTNNTLQNCPKMTVLILRCKSVAKLEGIGAFTGSALASNGIGGTLYVPQTLVDAYTSATNWSTILAYEHNSILSIEGSQYENYWADGTPITS